LDKSLDPGKPRETSAEVTSPVTIQPHGRLKNFLSNIKVKLRARNQVEGRLTSRTDTFGIDKALNKNFNDDSPDEIRNDRRISTFLRALIIAGQKIKVIFFRVGAIFQGAGLGLAEKSGWSFYRSFFLILGVCALLIFCIFDRYLNRKLPDADTSSDRPSTPSQLGADSPLPRELEKSTCSQIIVNDSIRKEFLNSPKEAVQLRVYDCLELIGRFVERDSFGSRLKMEDSQIYPIISKFLNELPQLVERPKGCENIKLSIECLVRIQWEGRVDQGKKLDYEKLNNQESGLFLVGITLVKAREQLKLGKVKNFQKLLLKSLIATPDYLTGLRSNILVWGQTKLLLAGEPQLARQLNQYHRKILDGEKEIYAWAPKFLYLYCFAEKREQLVNLAFSSVGAIQLVKSPIVIDLLVPEVLKSGVAADFLDQLEFVREFYQDENGKDDALGEKMTLWKARVLVFLQKPDEANQLLKDWLKNGYPPTSDYWMLRGIVARELADHKDALVFLKKAEGSASSRWVLAWNRSLEASRCGEHKQSQKYYEQFRKLSFYEGKEKEAWRLLLESELALSRRDYKSAYPKIKRFLRLMPLDPRGWELLQEVTEELGKKAESIKARMKVDEVRGQLRYYVTDRHLYAPLGALAGLN